MTDGLLARLLEQGFRCRECGSTFTADEYAYGHDCEVE